jgi:uncharacterized repeat protein (TIGR01451 family)
MTHSFLLESDNVDSSDAPISYGIANHTITGIRLGASVDANDPNLSSANALGDDANNTDDEDGVTMPNKLAQGLTTPAIINVQNANGYLNVWADWNRDGDFLDAGEQLANDQAVSVGDVNFNINTPSTAAVGTSFLRFRVCNSAGICNTPKGEASSGEVEDYALTVRTPVVHNCPSNSVNGGFATSGTGLFLNSLYWLDWSCGAVSQFEVGDTVNKSWTLPNGVQLAAQVSRITQDIAPYNTGEWAGDQLHNLYSSVNPIGLINVNHGEDPQFNITFSATYNGLAFPTDIFFADAEDASTSNESLTVSTSTGAPFEAIEANGVLNALFSADGKTLRLSDDANAGSGTLIALSKGGSDFSINLQAGGKQAIAFGVMLGYDYADAPTAYGSTPGHFVPLDAVGASRPTTTTPVTNLTLATVSPASTYYLGSNKPDIEAAQQATVAADGDGTDEDGLLSLPSLKQAELSTFNVKVKGIGGYLQAWIDWNGDGDFGDIVGGRSEQVALNYQDGVLIDTHGSHGDMDQSANGTIQFQVLTPANATTNPTYLRLRWSSTADLDSTSTASDGEIEDYALTIQANTAPVFGAGGKNVCVAAPVELLKNNQFTTVNGDGWTDWNVSVSNGSAYKWRSDQRAGYASIWLDTGNSSLSQTTQGGWNKGASSYGGAKLQLNLLWADASNGTLGTLSLSRAVVLEVRIGNAVYATLTTSPGYDFNQSGIINYYNGATGNLSTLNSSGEAALVRDTASPSSWIIELPDTVPATGDFSLRLVADPDVPSNADDILIDSVSALVCGQDYADAPSSYGAPSHAIFNGMYLGGVMPDAEVSALPSTDASADDTTGVMDEEGVTLPSLTQNSTTYISAKVHGAGGYLQGWIDWNQNGVFDAAEQVASDVQDGAAGDADATVNSQIKLTVSVPNNAVIGQSFARFRWSTTSHLNATDPSDNGEVEDYKVTIEPASYTVSGRVFNDKNLDNTPTTGSGLKDVTMVLYDIHTNSCRSVRTDANGDYRFFNVWPDIPNDYVVYEAANETLPTPAVCPPVAKDPNAYVSVTANSQNITVTNADVSNINFADVAKPSLLYAHEQTSAANSTVFYAHEFRSKANGTVRFNLTNVAGSASSNWQQVLYYDQDCDRNVDNTETLLTSALTVNADEKICLLVKVLTLSNAATGERQLLTLQSQFSYGNGTTGIADVIQTQTDVTTLSHSALENAQSLQLLKSVWNVSRNASGEAATPGETLQYTIQYNNSGNTALDEVSVYDTVPNFTQLMPSSVRCDATPVGLSCTPTIQGIDLQWLMTGKLPAGEHGTVSYQVTVQ